MVGVLVRIAMMFLMRKRSYFGVHCPLAHMWVVTQTWVPHCRALALPPRKRKKARRNEALRRLHRRNP